MASPNDPSPPAKAEEKTGFWSKVFSITPIILTVVATTLAGISSSELTQSMQWRSLATQNQSKASDQWSFFQAKRIRGTTLESTVDLMQSLGSADALTLEDLEAVIGKLDRLVNGLAPNKVQELGLTKNVQTYQKSSKRFTEILKEPAIREQLEVVLGGKFPRLQQRKLSTEDPAKQAEVTATAENIETVIQKIENFQTEADTAELVAKIKLKDVEKAVQLAEEDVDEADKKVVKPMSNAVDLLRPLINDMVKALKGIAANWSQFPESMRVEIKPLVEQFNIGMRMAIEDFNGRRYRAEAALNQRIALLYEVRVRRSGVESERHRTKSTLFFYAMIAAQAGVTIASLAMARTRKSLLWSIATLAGVASLGFAGWIYLTL